MAKELKYCPTCKKEVMPIKKVLGVLLCPFCNKILDTKYPMSRCN